MTENKYEIGGKSYVQQPLVLGQFRQLFDLLKGTRVPLDQGPMGLITALGDKLPEAFAVCLTEEGKSPKDKDIKALAAEIEYAFTAEMAMQAVDDFFVCNPLPLLLERLTGMVKALGGMTAGTGSPSSASSSPTATSPGETPLSGA